MDALERSDCPPVLVVGAGVAGLTAALDLARLGIPVHLVERDAHLGGQVMRLDKLYPSDHCGFCPVWTDGASCLANPLVTVHRQTSLEGLEPDGDGWKASLTTRTPAVDPKTCAFCGLCKKVCEAKGVPGAIQDRPPGLPHDPATPPVPFLDATLCSRCAECKTACPTGAVDPARLDLPAAALSLTVSDVVFATGFTERNPAPPVEYGHGSHPDILTAMEFEARSAEGGPHAGNLTRPSNGATPRSIAFIQCVGARDQRFLAYCASVCCMHALKQARWTKRRLPDTSVAIYFTDLRAVGKGYEAYARAAAEEGIFLVRSRPGLVFALPEENGAGSLGVRYEDTGSGKAIVDEFDMVVLGGGLVSCPLPGTPTPVPDEGRTCGFCSEPADVAQSVVQGSRAAGLVAARLATPRGGRP